MVSLADVSVYVRLAMSASNVWARPTQDEGSSQKNTCEEIMNAADQLRKSIRSRAFLFRKFSFNRQSIVEFDSALFWSYVPTLLKNVVGLLTLSEHQFQSIKNNHGFYDLMTKDLFIESSKCLKIASIAYDIINAQDEKAITPKHLLLGSEIFHHTRSAKLLKMTSRLGHTCGYDTVLRLHQEAAKLSRESSNPIVVARQQTKSYQQHFLVKVADNFDLNPDGIHGNVNNIHILNQILVSTSENDEILSNVQQLLGDMVNDVNKSMNNDLVSRKSFFSLTVEQHTSTPFSSDHH